MFASEKAITSLVNAGNVNQAVSALFAGKRRDDAKPRVRRARLAGRDHAVGEFDTPDDLDGFFFGYEPLGESGD